MESEPFAVSRGSRSRRNGRVYDEAAFRHLLSVDRRRAARATRVLFLVLIGIRRRRGRCARLTDNQAADLFDGLETCVRDTDLVGWYREGYVAAAVLPQMSVPGTAT